MTDHESVQQIVRLKDQAPLMFDPQKSALLIVDVQRYFARPEYPLRDPRHDGCYRTPSRGRARDARR